eukprot:1156727-Pelagomonas_calceolata.AAC.4
MDPRIYLLRQPHQLGVYPWHVHSIETKCYEDARSRQQLEVAQWRYADLCKEHEQESCNLSSILFNVGGTFHKEERKKNYVGVGNSPYINQGEGDTLAQKSRESPPLQSYQI